MNITSCRSTTRFGTHAATVLLLFVGGGLLLSGCGDASESAPRESDAPAASQNSIVDVAVAAGQFSTLLRAVEVAGLTETLEGDGPFTVFAPTDGAFADLPDGTLDALLEDPDALARILLYHVVPGELRVRDLRDLSELETAHGDMLRVADTRQGVEINGKSMLTSDISARNGIIHVMTSVLVPDAE